MTRQKIITSSDTALQQSDSCPEIPRPRQLPPSRDAGISGSGCEHRAKKPPKVSAKPVPGKPLKIDMQPIDAVRLLSAFGTLEPGFASLMLSSVINTACDGGPAHPPGSGDINNALAAVTGIGAHDEMRGCSRRRWSQRMWLPLPLCGGSRARRPSRSKTVTAI